VFFAILFSIFLTASNPSNPGNLQKAVPPLDRLHYLICLVDSGEQADQESSTMWDKYLLPFMVVEPSGCTSWRVNVWVDPVRSDTSTMATVDSVLATVAVDVRLEDGKRCVTMDMCNLGVLDTCPAIRAFWLPGNAP
jgi:hypothetical protein